MTGNKNFCLKMERLVLIDGHAILHRAFHALPPLTTSNGTPVNAVFCLSGQTPALTV